METTYANYEYVLKQYLDGAITFAEFVKWFADDYATKQIQVPATCQSCGSDLSKRL